MYEKKNLPKEFSLKTKTSNGPGSALSCTVATSHEALEHLEGDESKLRYAQCQIHIELQRLRKNNVKYLIGIFYIDYRLK